MSEVNNVMGFSVIGGLCHDIILEGALPYELKHLLQHAFNACYISLMQYNDRIKAFHYCYTGNRYTKRTTTSLLSR